MRLYVLWVRGIDRDTGEVSPWSPACNPLTARTMAEFAAGCCDLDRSLLVLPAGETPYLPEFKEMP